MELTHQFTIGRPLQDVWALLTDLRHVAAAVPGASVEDAESDGTHHGTLRMKIGAFAATFRGAARYTEVDEAARRVVLEGGGRSAQGNATLRLTGRATPSQDGTSTHVALDSTIELTGRIAQFGTSMAADVAAQVLDQFVANLTRVLESDATTETADGGTGERPTDLTASSRPRPPAQTGGAADVLDLGSALLPTLLTRAPRTALALAMLLGGVLLGRATTRHRPRLLIVMDPSRVETVLAPSSFGRR